MLPIVRAEQKKACLDRINALVIEMGVERQTTERAHRRLAAAEFDFNQTTLEKEKGALGLNRLRGHMAVIETFKVLLLIIWIKKSFSPLGAQIKIFRKFLILLHIHKINKQKTF